MKSSNGTYFVTVIEDLNSGRIIGAATLIYERKFIRECATVGQTKRHLQRLPEFY